MKYKSYRFVDGKARWVIVDEDGKIIDRILNKEEMKGLEKEIYIRKYNHKGGSKRYTDEGLLDYLRRFNKENGRSPTEGDFSNNLEYPSYDTYFKRFGSWANALKLVGLDVESMVKNGIVKTTAQKARFTEIMVRDHFKQYPTDLSGENCLSPCDGICPNGKMYDVKSSKLHKGKYWVFMSKNKYKEEIEIYYYLAFNSDWTKLKYIWRIPGEIVESDYFYLGLSNNYKFNVKNMKEYEITKNISYILEKYGLV